MSTPNRNSDNDMRTTRIAIISFAVLVVVIAALFFGTFASVVEIWRTTDAFTHGFFVVPLVLFLIWRERDRIARAPVQPSWLGVAALFGLSLLWWLGSRLDVRVLFHAAAVLSLPAAVVAAFGLPIAAIIRFPLLFMVFAVPAGEFLIPVLIDSTARLTVGSLSVLGIPVYQDGRFFFVPSGSYEVAKACSGLKFLIATLMLAILVAHIYFRRLWKSVMLVAFAIVAAVLANGLRATTVVLLLHFTDLDIADGPDHRFVGWIMYALLIVAMIWIAARFQDDIDSPRGAGNGALAPSPPAKGLRVALFAMLGLIVGPVFESLTRPASPDLDTGLGAHDFRAARMAPNAAASRQDMDMPIDHRRGQTMMGAS